MSEKDYDKAGDELNKLVERLEKEGLHAGAVLGGMLTTLIFRLIISSPDSSTAIGMITSCMASGARIAADFENECAKEEEVIH